jgi:hypothetical protein
VLKTKDQTDHRVVLIEEMIAVAVVATEAVVVQVVIEVVVEMTTVAVEVEEDNLLN